MDECKLILFDYFRTTEELFFKEIQRERKLKEKKPLETSLLFAMEKFYLNGAYDEGVKWPLTKSIVQSAKINLCRIL